MFAESLDMAPMTLAPVVRRLLPVAWLVGLWASSFSLGLAQDSAEPAAVQVALVKVHLPLTGSADQVLEATIGRARDRLIQQAQRNKDARRPVLVLQLEPPARSTEFGTGSSGTGSSGTGSGAGSKFERAFSLARFLCSRQMASVKTVAFVPQSIRGHSTLLALACEEMIMSAEATLGEAAVDEPRDAAVGPTVIGAYREIAETRRTMPVALALGMIDASAVVLQLETEQGTEFVLQSEWEKADLKREVIDQQVLVPAGELASYAGREGRKFGFVKFLASDRASLARVLTVPVDAIREEETLAGKWQPILIDLQGPITPRLASRIETMLSSALEQGANWVGLRIDSTGGDLQASVRLAMTLAKLDANAVRTVAYVPVEAKGEAALVALACDQLLMHPGAQLGTKPEPPGRGQEQGFPLPGVPGLPGPDRAAQLEAAATTLRQSLAPRAEQSWSLLTAMVDPTVVLFAYHHRVTGETRWWSAEEAQSLVEADAWQQGDPIVAARQSLVLAGERAAELGLARQTVEDFDQLKAVFGISEEPPVAQPNWALEFIEALASPELSVLLLMAALVGAYIEVRTPGFGVGAFVAAVSILLFFWSQYLNGTAGWLEVLLFLAGVSFLLMEIFVLPGFGIFGLGGGGLVIASIVLASLTFVRPHSEQDMEALSRSVGQLAIACAGLVAFVLVSRRYLPEAPIFRSLVLARLRPEERIQQEAREMLADYAHLVGKQGMATTHLRPAGKAQIDDALVDVIAESEPIDRGTPLLVIEAHAHRVVVRATGSARG
jgi:membrane-bound ClpP family serine protease